MCPSCAYFRSSVASVITPSICIHNRFIDGLNPLGIDMKYLAQAEL